jgi:hypothetical protein
LIFNIWHNWLIFESYHTSTILNKKISFFTWDIYSSYLYTSTLINLTICSLVFSCIKWWWFPTCFLEVQKQYYPMSKSNLVVFLYDTHIHVQMTNIDQNIKKLHYIFKRLKCFNNILIMDFSCYSYGCKFWDCKCCVVKIINSISVIKIFFQKHSWRCFF